MDTTKTAHRRRHHAWITRVKPPTQEEIEILQWTLDFAEFWRLSGCKSAAIAYADDLANDTPKRWDSSDPQCTGRWSGSKPAAQPYEPWSEDYSDAEPAWRREDWVGA